MAERAENDAVTLAGLWEGEASLRANAHQRGFLAVWASQRVIGVASTGAMALNIRGLEIMAEWWCTKVAQPQSIPIDFVRKEAGLEG